jgi:hypothetical protein
MDNERFRLIGGLLIIISVFLPLGFVIASHNQGKYYIHSWMFGLTYEEMVGGGQSITFYIYWLSIVSTIIILTVGAIITASTNQDNGKRVMILSITLLAYRVFTTIVAVFSASREGEYIYIYIPHVGFFITVIGCILAIISNTEIIEMLLKKPNN